MARKLWQTILNQYLYFHKLENKQINNINRVQNFVQENVKYLQHNLKQFDFLYKNYKRMQMQYQ